MASEKRDLIDRKELIKVAERKQFAIADNTHPYKAIMIQGMYFRGIVEDAPTVDAVEVIRCKDCKKRDTNPCPLYHCVNPMINSMDDGFCSYGERKDNG